MDTLPNLTDKLSQMKKWTLILYLFCCIEAQAQFDRLKNEASSSGTNSQRVLSESSWTYDTTEDKMTSKRIYFATLAANDLLQLNFPYNGGSVASILLQYRDGRNWAILEVTKGQFMASGDPEEIKVRFDDGKAETYYGEMPADHDSKTLFIAPSDRFITKLRRSKHVIVRVIMYNDGGQTMEFNTGNLIWHH